MFDYSTLAKLNYPSINNGKLINCRYITEHIELEQIIFIKEFKFFVVARLKTLKIIRTIFNPYVFTFVDLSNYILLLYGKKYIKMFVNVKNTSKLVRSFKESFDNRISFNGRLLSRSNQNRQVSETTIIDVSNMKIKALIQKHNANSLKSIFVNQLGLFLVLYVQQLDIYDSQSFQLIGSELLPDNKIYNKATLTMAYTNELIIFYQTKKKLKKEQNNQ
ncbi:hypothetical protein pb186bvf_009521 [Paramecium bursaria]